MTARRYTLLREIGRGGMGAVWLARDEVLGRQVAMKRVGLLPGGTNPDLLRAEREAKLAARLNHPHVVAVFDYVTDDEAQWLVMEYVDGTTLAELAREQGGLPPEEAARILRQAAEALAAAHGAGIVHRDVKPSNILVTSDGKAKLTDFGIARALADSTLTQTGLVTGSPAYLAPEVASGGAATDASDVWSLGATLFQALTGQPPYDMTDNVIGALYRIVHEPPPRLPAAGRLGTVLEHTMTPDPAHRWSMAQVRDALAGGPLPVAGHAAVVAPVLPVAGPPADPTLVTAAPYPAATPPAAAVVIAPNPLGPPPPARWPWPVVLGVVALVLVVAGVAWLLLRDSGEDEPTTRTDRTPGASAPSDTPSKTISSPDGPATTQTTATTRPTGSATESGMADFVRDYLAAVTEDPEAAFQMLTPEFQEDSGGYSEYRSFWAPIKEAVPSEISADPESLEVTYRVEYDGPNNRPADDRVRLRLAYDGERYLIASEDD